MGKITLGMAAQWCGGRIDPKYAHVVFQGAGNDSRVIRQGQLFVALRGERDGHDYIPMALEKGAAAVLCERPCGDVPAIIVDDALKALGQIAAQERLRLGMKVVAVTGSVGKSTTKEMIASVLGSTYRVAKTPANHNNAIGMPMAVLGIEEDTQIAVLEMGMNHFGEIAYLTRIAKPDLAVIINIGTMHIENLGSREGILRAKMEILEGMEPAGKILLNGDDDLLWACREKLPVSSTYFGEENTQCRVRAQQVREADGSVRFDAVCDERCFSVELPLEGRHYVSDALAAVAVGLELQISPDAICGSLAAFRNMAGRQEIFQAKDCTIIKDCYNAGPESMKAALTVLGNRPGRKVAVLGDMLELGARAAAEHYRVGRIAAEKVDVVLAYGPNGDQVVRGCITGGMPEGTARSFADRTKLIAALQAMAKAGDVILFKGSRGMQMELILEQFLKEET